MIASWKARGNPAHRAEKVFLRDKNIGYCIGCEACHQNNGVCVQKDDMAEILGKMIAADVIVMATPVYFYTMDAQMKTLIDRCVARYTEISNKAFYFIATAADGEKRSLERTIEGFRGFLYCLEGAQEKGIVYGSGAWKKGDIKESPALNEAYEMGGTHKFRYADSVRRPGCGWTAAEWSVSPYPSSI